LNWLVVGEAYTLVERADGSTLPRFYSCAGTLRPRAAFRNPPGRRTIGDCARGSCLTRTV